MRRFFRTQLPGVNHNLGIGGRFIGIRNTSELLDDSRARLGVQALPVALFAYVNRSRHVHEDEPTERLDHLPDSLACGLIGSNRSTHCDAAVLGDLGRDIPDAADVDVAMLFRESKLRRKVLADQIAIQQGDRTSAGFQELRDQRIRNR